MLPSYPMYLLGENRVLFWELSCSELSLLALKIIYSTFTASPCMLFEMCNDRSQDLQKKNQDALPGYSACTDLVKIFVLPPEQYSFSC